ncbi:MAG TPA: molybdate ABC transporter substrate-binding protein [Porticoccaceae bacterium]|nr:molybdate ABC transporter substrate-binding protein [Porticoccaceae bacterium]
MNLSLILTLWSAGTTALSDEIRVAVASNFATAMKALTVEFEKTTAHHVVLSFGSTGKHYAQIKNGAPFDVFLAADAARPALLEELGIALIGSRTTYARGKLVLWTSKPDINDIKETLLNSQDIRHLALANPKLSPYGLGAKQVMVKLDIWPKLQTKLVRGENIAQTFQFVHSGNAELGFVAYSQAVNPKRSVQGSFWMPPQSLYSPIDQQAVLLNDKQASKDFLRFLEGSLARQIIQNYGYDLP